MNGLSSLWRVWGFTWQLVNTLAGCSFMETGKRQGTSGSQNNFIAHDTASNVHISMRVYLSLLLVPYPQIPGKGANVPRWHLCMQWSQLQEDSEFRDRFLWNQDFYTGGKHAFTVGHSFLLNTFLLQHTSFIFIHWISAFGFYNASPSLLLSF